ncbi:MAG: crossover junction endodeoxyribonuclease RuvC [Planctomycetes bacterium]|nr:crossover junction endodeoxyribonuclease RuvC [Planctomycetota bacterium]
MKGTAARPAPTTRTSDAALDTILGVDPGLQRTGYAILAAPDESGTVRVREAGVIRLDPREALEQRLAELDRSLLLLIENHRPGTLACEELYAHYKHPRTAILMAHARGVVLSLGARLGLMVVPVAATQVKKTLTGSGRAGKVQIQRAVAATLGLPRLPEPDDVADALAIALCGRLLRDAARRVEAPDRGGAR